MTAKAKSNTKKTVAKAKKQEDIKRIREFNDRMGYSKVSKSDVTKLKQLKRAYNTQAGKTYRLFEKLEKCVPRGSGEEMFAEMFGQKIISKGDHDKLVKEYENSVRIEEKLETKLRTYINQLERNKGKNYVYKVKVLATD